MSRRLLHNLLLAAAVAALALFLLLKPEKAGPQKFPLSGLAPAEVTRIELAPREGAPVVLERRGGDWRMTAPFPARADRFRVDALLGILGANSETRLTGRDPAKFGLAPPHARLTVAAGSREQRFDFGDHQPVSHQVYVATGGAVYLVAPGYLVDVSRGAEDFASKRLLAEDESPVGFRLPGLSLRRENGTWGRDPDDGKLSTDQLNRFADEWRLATAISVRRAQGQGRGERLSVTLADGRTLAFTLLARDPELVLRREDEGLDYHLAPEIGARLLDPAAVQQP